MVKKVERGGKVAVLISPKFGAGWSTWADKENIESKLFCPEIVKAIEDGVDSNDLIELADSLFAHDYNSGVRDCRIEWVNKGEAFRVTEYDGSESLELIGKLDYYIA